MILVPVSEFTMTTPPLIGLKGCELGTFVGVMSKFSFFFLRKGVYRIIGQGTCSRTLTAACKGEEILKEIQSDGAN